MCISAFFLSMFACVWVRCCLCVCTVTFFVVGVCAFECVFLVCAFERVFGVFVFLRLCFSVFVRVFL